MVKIAKSKMGKTTPKSSCNGKDVYVTSSEDKSKEENAPNLSAQRAKLECVHQKLFKGKVVKKQNKWYQTYWQPQRVLLLDEVGEMDGTVKYNWVQCKEKEIDYAYYLPPFEISDECDVYVPTKQEVVGEDPCSLTSKLYDQLKPVCDPVEMRVFKTSKGEIKSLQAVVQPNNTGMLCPGTLTIYDPKCQKNTCIEFIRSSVPQECGDHIKHGSSRLSVLYVNRKLECFKEKEC
jgi:hypothetical protein